MISDDGSETADSGFSTAQSTDDGAPDVAIETAEGPRSSDHQLVAFDPERETPSAVVVRAVAVLLDRRPDELDRLFDDIDPDWLDALFAPLSDGTVREEGRITFTYHGFTVTVHGGGAIEVRPRC